MALQPRSAPPRRHFIDFKTPGEDLRGLLESHSPSRAEGRFQGVREVEAPTGRGGFAIPELEVPGGVRRDVARRRGREVEGERGVPEKVSLKDRESTGLASDATHAVPEGCRDLVRAEVEDPELSWDGARHVELEVVRGDAEGACVSDERACAR